MSILIPYVWVNNKFYIRMLRKFTSQPCLAQKSSSLAQIQDKCNLRGFPKAPPWSLPWYFCILLYCICIGCICIFVSYFFKRICASDCTPSHKYVRCSESLQLYKLKRGWLLKLNQIFVDKSEMKIMERWKCQISQVDQVKRSKSNSAIGFCPIP